MADNKWAMLCKLKAEAFDDPNWRWERKLDGDRMKVTIGPDDTTLMARSGADKTAQFPELAGLTFDMQATAVIDCELVSAGGLTFQEFNQRRMNRTKFVAEMARQYPARLMAFDVLEICGEDFRHLSLATRRNALESMGLAAKNRGRIEVVEQHDGGVALFERAIAEGWEGVVGKDMTRPYRPGRRDWVKVKVWLPPREYYVIGFTVGTGKREALFGAFMLGELDAATGELRYVGDCGTGLDDQALRWWNEKRLGMRMALGDRVTEVALTPCSLPRIMVKAVEVTNAGSLRFPVYCGAAK